ncbi:MAG: molybdopterin-dependent oxidoreductase, partial [Chloroflexi bacterium]|nr:molybdopterin-dependent oxidoreductase [Chloroflexota bacterium]
MSTPHMSRRDLLLQGSVAIAGLALLRAPRLAFAFSAQDGEEVLTWLDQPAANAAPDVVGVQLQWEALDSWITPNDQFFTVGHYNKPVLDASSWSLQIGGLVQQPMTLTLDDLKARPRQEVTFALECSGNNGLPFLTGAVGNATWAGTPL